MPMASRRSSNSAASTGKKPANTTLCASREAGQGFSGRISFVGDRIADARIGHFLDLGGEEADLAGAKACHHFLLGARHADAVEQIGAAGAHHLDPHALFNSPSMMRSQNHNAEIGIIPAVNQQRLQRLVEVALGGGQARDNGFQHIGNAKPGLGRNQNGVGGINADHIFNLLADALRLGGGQIDLVEHGHDFKIVVDGLIDIGQRLRFHTLRSVHHQQRAFAGGQRARDFIGKVHMARRVDQVQHIVLAVFAPCNRGARCWP